jgi:hypothetical protein
MNNKKRIKPSNCRISQKMWKLYSYFLDYQNSRDDTFLKRGYSIVQELTSMGQSGFTEKEIKFIDSYIDACIEIGIR